MPGLNITHRLFQISKNQLISRSKNSQLILSQTFKSTVLFRIFAIRILEGTEKWLRKGIEFK